MNSAHTPQALSLPHLQIAEVSAGRRDENEAFDRAAARLRPSWMRAEPRESTVVLGRSDGTLRKALRQHALARSDAEADDYRRRLLGDVARNERTVRGAFIAAVVGACALVGLSDGAAPAQAARAATRPTSVAVAAPAVAAPAVAASTKAITRANAAPTPAVGAVSAPAPGPTTADAAPHPAPTAAPHKVAPPKWKARAAGAQPAWKPPATAASAPRLQGNVPAPKRPAIAAKRVPAQPARAPLAPAKR